MDTCVCIYVCDKNNLPLGSQIEVSRGEWQYLSRQQCEIFVFVIDWSPSVCFIWIISWCRWEKLCLLTPQSYCKLLRIPYCFVIAFFLLSVGTLSLICLPVCQLSSFIFFFQLECSGLGNSEEENFPHSWSCFGSLLLNIKNTNHSSAGSFVVICFAYSFLLLTSGYTSVWRVHLLIAHPCQSIARDGMVCMVVLLFNW